jgi:hypothetical protein
MVWSTSLRCERQDALHVEFFELAGVTRDPRECELLPQFFSVAVVRLDVDRALEEERFVETVELLLDDDRVDRATATSALRRSDARLATTSGFKTSCG